MAMGDKRPSKGAIGGKKREVTGKAAINRHEAVLAKKLGGHRQPLSGALDQFKGDVILDHGMFSANKFLFDSKETVGSSIIVAGKDLTKACREAAGESKEPGMIITIHKLPSTTPKEWVMVPIQVFADMLERIRQYESNEANT